MIYETHLKQGEKKPMALTTKKEPKSRFCLNRVQGPELPSAAPCRAIALGVIAFKELNNEWEILTNTACERLQPFTDEFDE